MKLHVGIGTVLLALLWLGSPGAIRADYVFTSQPINGHVLEFWIGISPEKGSGSLSVDMKDPSQPGLFIAGSTGRHFLRLGMNVDGVGIYPDLNGEGELPELVGGNPASYTFAYEKGSYTLNFLATTSPGGEIVEDPAYDSYEQPQPGFPTAGWTTFMVNGSSLSSTFDVSVVDDSDLVGILSVEDQRVIWNDPIEVSPENSPGTPVVETPEPGSALLLGLGAVVWMRLRRRFDS